MRKSDPVLLTPEDEARDRRDNPHRYADCGRADAPPVTTTSLICGPFVRDVLGLEAVYRDGVLTYEARD